MPLAQCRDIAGQEEQFRVGAGGGAHDGGVDPVGGRLADSALGQRRARAAPPTQARPAKRPAPV
jgi:hypothetical protein